MPHVNDLSRSLTALDQNSTLIAVIEMSLKSEAAPISWSVGGLGRLWFCRYGLHRRFIGHGRPVAESRVQPDGVVPSPR